MTDGVNTGRLAYLPASLFGSVMGWCGLALAWRLAAAKFGLSAWIGEALGLVAAGLFVALSLAYGIKCVASPAAVLALATLKFAMHQPSWPAQAFALAMLAFTTFIILSLSVRTIAGILRGELRALTL